MSASAAIFRVFRRLRSPHRISGPPALLALIFVMLLCWQAVSAQGLNSGNPDPTDRQIEDLLGSSNAAFERLLDPCYVHQGERVCPATDSDPDDPDQPKGPPPQRGVTWMPGVRGELNRPLALEDRLNDLMAASSFAEARRVADELIALTTKESGADLKRIAHFEQIVGDILFYQGQLSEAENQYRNALKKQMAAIASTTPLVIALGADQAVSLAKLALVASAQGRTDEADRLFARATRLAIVDPNMIDILFMQATHQRASHRLTEAKELFRRGAELGQAMFGDESTSAAYGKDQEGRIALAMDETEEAVGDFRLAAKISTPSHGRSSEKALFAVGQDKADIFRDLAAALYALARQRSDQEDSLREEAFEAAQQADHTAAEAALSQVALRRAKGDDPLSVLIREQHDLVTQQRNLTQDLTDALSVLTGQPDNGKVEALRHRLADTNHKIRENDHRLESEFPEYFELVRPKVLSAKDVQGLLRPNEVLVKYLFTAADVLVWVVTPDMAQWFKADASAVTIADDVQALRCGLDYEGAWLSAGSRCTQLLSVAYSKADHDSGKLLPFDFDRAHRLYQALLKQAEGPIKGKHLLVVSSGPLTQLPLHVLLTDQQRSLSSAPLAFRKAAWLVRRHAITVLPAVSSLSALRGVARFSRATRPFLGVGNPLLDGPDSRYAQLADAARTRQTCRVRSRQRLAIARGPVGSPQSIAQVDGLADIEQIRKLAPLPETADEVCSVGNMLAAYSSEIRLGSQASETMVKTLSARGALSSFHIIHFATHGALAGQIIGNAEPGLILTPPATASLEDDGYLSASEIADLRLDADWVILSACNTAAGGARSAEALSGLARAFFYAGARALLVSHWSVDSQATVSLITTALSTMATDNSVGRAESLRRSMLALIQNGTPRQAHPAYWASFVVVGEGSVVH